MTKWYVCIDCGYSHEGEEAPEHCPSCGSFYFESEEEEEEEDA